MLLALIIFDFRTVTNQNIQKIKALQPSFNTSIIDFGISNKKAGL